MTVAMTSALSDLAPQAERLTKLYILALSAVACLSIFGQLLVQWSLDRQFSDSTVVNLAGRQRMLSQRLTKAALAWEKASSPGEASARSREMSEVLAEWRRADEGLRQGDRVLGLPGRNSSVVRLMLDDIEPHFRAMTTATETLLRGADNQQQTIDQLLANEPQFLGAMDAIVKQYELEARQRVAWLKGIERSLLLLTLLVLACEGVLIFRPAIRRLRSTAAAMEESRQQLELAKQLADSASEAKSRFLATISHELRNPLQAIVGSVELANQTTDNAKRSEHIETISVAARALLVLLNDLLDLARIEAGKLAIVPAPVDAVQLTERVLAMVQPRADAQGLQVDWEVVDEIPNNLCGDEIRVQQVLLNLLTNALKFTKSGNISVRMSVVRQESDHVRLRWEVRDTGIGIPDDQQAVIFDHFTQVSGIAEQKGGAGLGLAICKRLVELMHGEIGVESKLGLGSAFWFELPFAHSVNGEPSVMELGKQLLGVRRRVLLVDDDPINRSLLSQLVESLGHHVVAAVDGEDAIMKYREEPFDAAIVDWQMPGMNGGQVAARLRMVEREMNRPRMTIIALSAAIEPQAGQEVFRSCFDRWLTKPIRLAELATVLGSGAETPDESKNPDSRWAQPLARLGGRRELLAELAQSWSTGLPDILETLQVATKEHRAQEVARLAHLISGQASIFDAHELVSSAKSVEEHAGANRVVCSLVTTLEAQCWKLGAELQFWLDHGNTPSL